MKCIVKMLVEIDVLDDPAARKKFREVAADLTDTVEGQGIVRELKLIEDRSGRLIDRWEEKGNVQ